MKMNMNPRGDSSIVFRAGLALAMVLVLAGAALMGMSRPVQATQPTGTADFQLQLFGCPDRYDGLDFLNDCTAGATESSMADLIGSHDEIYNAQADENGIARFGNIPAGTYQFGSGVFREFLAVYYACFDITSGSEEFLFDGTATVLSAGRKIDLTAGGSFSCRWYAIPGSGASEGTRPADPVDASVGVQVRICPTGYDGNAFLTDCAPTADPTGVTLNDGVLYDEDTTIADTTSDEGRAGFVDLMTGEYFLEVSPDDIAGPATFYTACFDVSSGAEVYQFDQITNGFSLQLAQSADLFCRVYVIPYGSGDDSGTVAFMVRSCPQDDSGPGYEAACLTGLDEFSGYLFPGDAVGYGDAIDQGHLIDGTTRFDGVPAGDYTVMTDLPGHAINFFGACAGGDAVPADDSVEATSGSLSFSIADGATITCVLYLTGADLRG